MKEEIDLLVKRRSLGQHNHEVYIDEVLIVTDAIAMEAECEDKEGEASSHSANHAFWMLTLSSC